MNIAVPALVILLGLLPGIACFLAYFNGKFERRLAGVSGADELALYVVLSIPIDALALWVCRFFGIELEFTVVTMLLSGSSSDAAVATVAAIFREHSYLTAATYTLILMLSYTIGSIVRRFVWAFRLDTWIPRLRMRPDWFYLLQARQKGMERDAVAFVDVLTKHPDSTEGSRLYRGLVVEFEISDSRKIDTLILSVARRGTKRGKEFEWRRIPSDRFVIMGSSIHTINVSYLSVDTGPSDRWERTKHRMLTCVRSFLFEEP